MPDIIQAGKQYALPLPLCYPKRYFHLQLLHHTFIHFISRMACDQCNTSASPRIIHPYPVKTEHKRCIVHFLNRTTHTIYTNSTCGMFISPNAARTVCKASLQMKSHPVCFRRKRHRYTYMGFRIILHQPALLSDADVLHPLPQMLAVTGFGKLCHLFIEIPKRIVSIAFIIRIGSWFRTLAFHWTPTGSQPACPYRTRKRYNFRDTSCGKPMPD